MESNLTNNLNNKEQSLSAISRLDNLCAQSSMNRVQHYQFLNDINFLTKELQRLYKLEEEKKDK